VARIWRAWGIQPWREETFKFSTDPQLEAKVRDVIGLYLNPPEGAVVLCVDEKSQVQALERSQPMLPVRPGLAARPTHDYTRHGTTTLFAALEVATGKVTDVCQPRHRHQEFLHFLKRVARQYPRVQLHLSGGRRESHPPAPTERSVTVSCHSALLIQSSRIRGSTASARTVRGRVSRPAATTP
jgi:hypothetical protein